MLHLCTCQYACVDRACSFRIQDNKCDYDKREKTIYDFSTERTYIGRL